MNKCFTEFGRHVVSPFAKLNLVRNPFGELTRSERGELAVADCRIWVAALSQPDSAVQFLGPCGHGKTTHLLALARALPAAVYIYLPPTGRQPSIPRHRPLLIDEAQRLGRWHRRRVFATGGPLGLGTHEDLRPILERYGLQVLTVDVAADLSPERLVEIVNRRVEASRREVGPVPRIDLPQAIELRRKYGGDIRRIEEDLYLYFQQLAEGAKTWQPAR